MSKQPTRTDFQKTVYAFYANNARSLPWREPDSNGSFDPYKIMVSEIMLQQTQVSRVTPKYVEFIGSFPSVGVLARASLQEVMQQWQGLGYNRRARFLLEAAQTIVSDFGGSFPNDAKTLTRLPGIGSNTAAAIVVYSFNVPELFIETNIRTVYLHHFFSGQQQILDKQILEQLDKTIDRRNPRAWYWALMDYGSWLKKTVGNVNAIGSSQYKKQRPFAGSVRQVRGRVLKQLVEQPRSYQALVRLIADDRLDLVLQQLCAERLIEENADTFRIAS